jgi:GAF domain-containing protein
VNQDQAHAAVAGSRLDTDIESVRRSRNEQDTDPHNPVGVTAHTDEAVHSALQTMVSLAASAVDGAASCGVTVTIENRTFTVVHTDARTLLVDAEQYTAGDGPCLHAARTGEVVRADAVSAAQRWPVFVDGARRENIHSFLAAPLRSGGTTFGSLNLYGERPAAFTDADVDTVTSITGTLSRTLGDYRRFDRLLDQYNGLRSAIDHRAPIEQAKGMLMAVHRIDADAAFAMLAEQSMTSNRKVRDIAVELVDSIINPGPDTTAPDAARRLIDPPA